MSVRSVTQASIQNSSKACNWSLFFLEIVSFWCPDYCNTSQSFHIRRNKLTKLTNGLPAGETGKCGNCSCPAGTCAKDTKEIDTVTAAEDTGKCGKNCSCPPGTCADNKDWSNGPLIIIYVSVCTGIACSTYRNSEYGKQNKTKRIYYLTISTTAGCAEPKLALM